MGLFGAHNQTILKPSNGERIDFALVEYLRFEFGAKAVAVANNGHGEIESISLPQREFRERLQNDSGLRNAVRGASLEIQDVSMRGRSISLGALMSAPVYVSDAKTVGARRADGSGVNLLASLQSLRSTLEDWGQVRIPAIILLALGLGTVGAAAWMGRQIVKEMERVAALNHEASGSDAGLERVLAIKAGRRPTSAPANQVLEEEGPLAEGELTSSHDSSPR